MDEVSRLTLAVDSTAVRKATGDLDQLGKRGKESEQQVRGLAGSFGLLKGAIAGVALGTFARATLQAADSFSTLNARLSLATKGTAEFTKAQGALFEISQRTRTGFVQTADLFGSLARSTESLGVSQSALLGVTETINQALVVSGTSAQSAAAALTQLGQGFSAGALRGEELNSILEQAPRLARAIADGLGVPLGKLRELGQAGELTADRVFTALQKSSESIRVEFAKMPQTVESATTQAGNSILKLIGTIDELAGASAGLARFVSGQAGGIGALAEEFRLAKVEGQGFLEVIGRIFKFFSPSLLGGGPTSVEDRLETLKGRLQELTSLLDTPRRLSLFSGQATELEAERRQIEKTISALQALDTSAADAESAKLLRQQVKPQAKPTPKAGKAGKAEVPFALTFAGGRFDPQAIQREAFLRSEKEAYETLSRLESEAAEEVIQAKEREAQARLRVLEIAQRADELATQQADALAEQNAALRDEVELIGKSAEQRAMLIDAKLQDAIASKELDLINLKNAEASAAQIGALEREIELLRQRRELLGQKGVLERSSDAAKSAADEAKEATKTLNDMFTQGLIQGEKFSDLLKRIAQEIATRFLRKKLTGALEGLFDALGSALFSANGNAFGPAGLIPFATGGIVNQPTVFGFGGGKTGVMGEAGPEAILPLRRGPGGMLGVQASTGGAQRIEIVNPPGVPLQGRTQQSGDIVRVILSEVARDVRSGGDVAKAVQGTYGASRGGSLPRRG